MLFVMQEWAEYFMKLLGGRKEKGKAETEMKMKQTMSEQTEVTIEEVERQIWKLQKRKAPERDGVHNEG
jgi:uncharacterized protein YceH (UPF0502 family)